MHGARTAVATVVLACDLAIDVADKQNCYTSEDEINDDFLYIHTSNMLII